MKPFGSRFSAACAIALPLAFIVTVAAAEETALPASQDSFSSSSCAMSGEEVTSAVQRCKEQGLTANVKKEGTCYKFIDCVKRPVGEKSVAASSVPKRTLAKKSVACTKTVKESCVVVTCTDGFKFNSCELAQMCKRLAGTEQAKTVSSAKPAPCAEVEKALQSAYAKWEQDQANPELKRIVDEYRRKLGDCKKADLNKTLADPALGATSECKIVKNEATGCQEKRCGDNVVEKRCPESGAASSSECVLTKDSATGCYEKRCAGTVVEKRCPSSSSSSVK